MRTPSVLLAKKVEVAVKRNDDKKIAAIEIKIQKLKNAISKLEARKRKIERET